MGVVCEHCGVRGWPENLVGCCKCSNAYVHCYCFEDAYMILKGDAEWTCPDCRPKPAKLLPSRRSKRISSEHVKRSTQRLQLLKKTKHGLRLKSLNGRKGIISVLAQEKGSKSNDIFSAGGAELPPSSVLAQETILKCNVTSSAQAIELPPCSVLAPEKSPKCNENSQAEGAKLPLNVDSRYCNLLEDRCSVNSETRDPLLEFHEDKLVIPKEKVPSVLVDDYISRVISLSKDGSSVILNNGYVTAQPVKEPMGKSSEYTGNSSAEGVKLLVTVDARDGSLLNNGSSGNVEMGDSSLVVTDHEEKGSVPKEKISSVMIDGYASRVISVSKDGSSIMLNDGFYIPAAPVDAPIWAGCFSIFNEGFQTVDGVAAHLSNRVGLKVQEEARLLPVDLRCDILPKATVWPNRFQQQRPTDDDIALYFFPETERIPKKPLPMGSVQGKASFTSLIGYLPGSNLLKKSPRLQLFVGIWCLDHHEVFSLAALRWL
ncbi:PHD finger-containing protein [Drosera capensis]